MESPRKTMRSFFISGTLTCGSSAAERDVRPSSKATARRDRRDRDLMEQHLGRRRWAPVAYAERGRLETVRGGASHQGEALAGPSSLADAVEEGAVSDDEALESAAAKPAR